MITFQPRRKYTWKPDVPDFRDHVFAAKIASLPSAVDLRPRLNKVFDQGNLGSCTGNAISTCIDMQRVKQGSIAVTPSRLLIYYMERVMEGSVNYDAGAMIRDGIKAVNKQGYVQETLWPYTISKFKDKPPVSVFNEATKNTIKSYERLDNSVLNDLKTCLSLGFAFVFGFAVYDSFETAAVAKTGIVPMPARKDKFLGGHAVCCVGYNDATSRFTVRNSWGTGWGDKGHFYIPYSYLTNTSLADDFWTIKLT